MDQGKISAVLDWPTPTSVKEIQRFLGFANYYCRFIPQFSRLVKPLTDLTRKDVKFHWTTTQEESLSALKELFCSAPVLIQPDPQKSYRLETDASNHSLGGVLSQRDETGKLHPVAYFSKKLLPAEENYSILEKELLAIKEALSHWRHHLEGTLLPIEILTDHRNLEYLKNAKCRSARHARWSLFFSRFNMHIAYRPGVCNAKADALSRLTPDTSLRNPNTPETILESSCFGTTVKTVTTEINEWVPDIPTEEVQEIKNRGFDIHLDDLGRWSYHDKLVVPKNEKKRIFQWIHEDSMAGHPGVRKTLDLCSRMFWWPEWRKDVESYVYSCPICAQSKTTPNKPAGRLQPIPITSKPWETIAMDFISDLPMSAGKTVIWVTVDLFSKMVHFVPLAKLPDAMHLVSLFLEHIYKLHGLPKKIISDRGPQFVAKFWKELLTFWGIEAGVSTAYHPQTDGQTERTNQTLEQFLRCYITKNERNWSRLLPMAEFAFNNTFHTAIGMTPFECVNGQSVRMIPSIPADSKNLTKIPAVKTTIEKMDKIHQCAEENLIKARENYTYHANTRRRDNPQYQPGEFVWLATRNLKITGYSRKFKPRFVGPFRILDIVSKVNVKLKLPNSWKIHNVFHVSLVKPARVTTRLTQKNLRLDCFEMEALRIIRTRNSERGREYLLAWKGCPTSENSWEQEKDIDPRLITEFEEGGPEGGNSVRNPTHLQ